jgi:small-conductance mechanosensitive channel
MGKIIKVIKNNFIIFGLAIALIAVLSFSYYLTKDIRFLWVIGVCSTYTTVFFGLHLRDAMKEIKEPRWVKKVKIRSEDDKLLEILIFRIRYYRLATLVSLIFFYFNYAGPSVGWLYITTVVVTSLWFMLSAFCWASSVITKRDWKKYLREKEKQQKKQELLLEAQDILYEINEVIKR